MSVNVQDYRISLQDGIDVLEEEFVDPRLSKIRNSTILQLIFFIILVISGILTTIQPNLASIFAFVGVGAGGISADWDNLKKVFKEFTKDRQTIKYNYGKILLEFSLADLELTKLQNVEELIRAFYNRILETP